MSSFIYLLFPPFGSQVMFYSLAVVTFGTAVPAGQFVPGIMIGSTYGRLVGMFVVKFYKKLNIEEGTWVLAISLYPHMQYCHINLCSLCVIVFALNRPWRHYSFVQMGMLFDGFLVGTWHNFLFIINILVGMHSLVLHRFSEVQWEWLYLYVLSWLRLQTTWNSCHWSCLFF